MNKKGQITVKHEITKFMLSASKFHTYNQWIETTKIDLYLRRGIHIIEGNLETCLDLANVKVKPEYQGQGVFKHAFKLLEDKNLFTYMYVENVFNKDLANYLLKLRYKPIYMSDCYYHRNLNASIHYQSKGTLQR